MGNFLDKQGVTHLWGKAKETFEPKGEAKKVDDKLANYIPTSQKGANNGVATLDGTGKVPTSQLPSYVSDVFEFANKTSFPTTGEANKIYVAKDTNLTYRWSGSAYVEISPSLALGETSETAYAGDKGKQLRTDFDAHKSDTDIHITAAERTKWNGNTNNTGTVTNVATGAGLSGGPITTSGTIKVALKSETKNSAAAGNGKLYPVELDSAGVLAVNVPWTDTATTYTALTNDEIDEAIAAAG